MAGADAAALADAGPIAADAATGASAGASAVAADSSSAALTRRCTSGWMPPASGTRDGMPVLRTAAVTSAITHQTNCSQASHTTTEQARSIVAGSSRWVNSDAEGMLCGIGRPKTLISATGTPARSTSSTTMAPRPVSVSPVVRRRLTGRTGLRVCADISTHLPG